MDLSFLNKEQKKAVLKTEGPLLILAGAGSGKTKVLTTRIAYLVLEKNVEPENILAITFTNKAAKEMKERIFDLIGPLCYEMQISTFHSFGLRIMKKHATMLGYSKNFNILDSDDSNNLIKTIIKDFNYDIDYKVVKNIISSNKNALVDAFSYERFVSNDLEKDVYEIYKKYEEKLKLNNCLDFDDLLMLPIVLFKKNPKILKEYQEQYKYILIDEYQDTNEAQYSLAKMISAKYLNICVVGDDSQSIYSWRGSNYKNILNFEKDYRGCSTILLEQNYRSTKTIINASNDVINNNKMKKDKKLWTDNEDGEKVVNYKAVDEKDEAFYVANKINELIDEGYDYKDIVVLYRTNAQSRTFEEQFLIASIPYKIIGSTNFYGRKEIKDILAYLKLIYNPNDDTSFLRVINTPKRKIGKVTIDNIKKYAYENNCSLYNSIVGGKEFEFKVLIEYFRSIKDNVLLTELVEEILNKSGLRKELELDDMGRVENLEEFKSICYQFQENYGIITLEDFLDEVSLITDLEKLEVSDNNVTLMTIHLSKGLEFKFVFIVGLEESIFPHFNSFGNEEALEEERRLMYVAMTRARLRLWLLNTSSRLIYGNRSANKDSRFIKEIDSKHFNHISVKNININGDIEYHLGEKILFDLYGVGIIVGIDDKTLTVAFSAKYGVKKLIKGHKNIKKI